MTETCLQREARRLTATVARLWDADPKVVGQAPGSAPWAHAQKHARAEAAREVSKASHFGTMARQRAAQAFQRLYDEHAVGERAATDMLYVAGHVATALAAQREPPDRKVWNEAKHYPASYCQNRRRLGVALAEHLTRRCPSEVRAYLATRRRLAWFALRGPAASVCPPLQAQFDSWPHNR